MIKIEPGDSITNVIANETGEDHFLLEPGVHGQFVVDNNGRSSRVTVEAEAGAVIEMGRTFDDWKKESYYKRVVTELDCQHHSFSVIEKNGEALSRMETYDQMEATPHSFWVDPSTDEVYVNHDHPDTLYLSDWKDEILPDNDVLLLNLDIRYGVNGVGLREYDRVAIVGCKFSSISFQGILGGGGELVVAGCDFSRIGKRWEIHKGSIRENNKDHSIYTYGYGGSIIDCTFNGIPEHQTRPRYDIHLWHGSRTPAYWTITGNDIAGTAILKGKMHVWINNSITGPLQTEPKLSPQSSVLMDDGWRTVI